MKKGVIIALVIVGVIVLVGFWMMGTFVGYQNKFVSLDEDANKSWAQVENQQQRRFDLIPNLVNTVKGYASHEKDVLTAVTEARSRVGSAKSIPDKMAANGALTSALGRLMVVMERYPDLKANQNFLELQSQLEGTENRIAVERRRYNEAVAMYNTAIRMMPGSLFANILNFDKKELFEADKAAQKAPEVKF